MKAGTCPNCGAAVGAGVLDGLCPKCLVAGDTSGQTTEGAVAVLEKVGAVRTAAGEGSSSALPGHVQLAGGGPASPGFGTPGRPERADVGLRNPDRLARDVRDAIEDERPASSWVDRAPLPKVDGYDILREVKHGGQGIVYLAVQRSTKRKVAIKVLLAGCYAGKAARRRFEREIELVASLKHPNIIAVFDSGTTADGHEYYVMDYVRGVPITQYVREKKPSLEQALSLFTTTCDAVNHAHQRGVIHRDLKPSNVLVDVDGNVRVWQ